jgi:transketolase
VAAKWRAFGWEACAVDGHDHAQLFQALRRPHPGRPKIIIARTTKGKGVSFMEDELRWHYYIVTKEFEAQALRELGG